jgi:hypothetical protein
MILIDRFDKTNNSKSNTNRKLLSEEVSTSENIKKDKEIKSSAHPISQIKCNNQTQCIQPYLQLQKTYNVYYCKHASHGVRFYYLVREGLLLHPKINLVSTPEAADIVVYLPESANWHKTECANPAYRNKTVVLDEGDGQQVFDAADESKQNRKFVLLFKRSYVRRQNGQFRGFMGYLPRTDILPMTYTIADAYVRPAFNMLINRNLEILCTLRGSNADPVRLRVRQWVQEYAKARGVKSYSAGEVNSASRTVISMDYFNEMYRAQIIVTSNPSGWEGDFRLCEALASGALILVDQMFVPRPYPLVDNQHIVYYDNSNKTDLFEKLDFYRREKEKARRVAVSGYLHTMKYHRAANLIDYVFRTVHVKQQAEARGEVALLDPAVSTTGSDYGSPTNSAGGLSTVPQAVSYGYTDTGFQLRLNAIASTKKPTDKTSNIGFS